MDTKMFESKMFCLLALNRSNSTRLEEFLTQYFPLITLGADEDEVAAQKTKVNFGQCKYL